MELPRAVMRGATAVVLMSLLLALLMGLWRARADMRDELAGALALARASAALSAAPTQSDSELIAALSKPLIDETSSGGSRHLSLRLLDEGGRVRLAPPAQDASPAWMNLLVALNGVLFAPPPDQMVVTVVPRPQGDPWQAQWIASHDYEQHEALAQLAETMLLLAVCSVLVLTVMRWRMQRAFLPLKSLLVAIGQAERQDLSAVRALPTMPVRELDVIAGALRHLGGRAGARRSAASAARRPGADAAGRRTQPPGARAARRARPAPHGAACRCRVAAAPPGRSTRARRCRRGHERAVRARAGRGASAAHTLAAARCDGRRSDRCSDRRAERPADG